MKFMQQVDTLLFCEILLLSLLSHNYRIHIYSSFKINNKNILKNILEIFVLDSWCLSEQKTFRLENKIVKYKSDWSINVFEPKYFLLVHFRS